jgi:hypothetical protein
MEHNEHKWIKIRMECWKSHRCFNNINLYGKRAQINY